MMTPESVRKRVRQVARAGRAGDDARAHGLEDALWADVLDEIASGVRDAGTLAREALKTRNIQFSRWVE